MPAVLLVGLENGLQLGVGLAVERNVGSPLGKRRGSLCLEGSVDLAMARCMAVENSAS